MVFLLQIFLVNFFFQNHHHKKLCTVIKSKSKAKDWRKLALNDIWGMEEEPPMSKYGCCVCGCRCSMVVSILSSHVGDPGSIRGNSAILLVGFFFNSW